ncbi:MAG: Fe2+-dependent dioxygenase, partial [Gammaproteobacteria bacterium]|nr:Fe2+-dependent dioxygenase [Gammaproteobacteria bacterium]
MMLHLPSVLESNQLEAVQQLLADAKFVDGKLSAGAAAQRVKRNQELDKGASQMDILNNIVMNSLVQHPVYRAGALPLRVAAPYYARYTPGMAYGDHLDDPIMGADGVLYRSDIAITIFLNAPDKYDGGELVIRTAFGDNAAKLSAGDAVMYPASSRHHVNPVTRGERLVAVTWVQSLVRDPARRELLYELHQAREKLLRISPEAEETAQVNTAYMNLIRMWGDV